ncbi:hypothetical protein ACFLYU_00500 [Candidatus Dependentiae bacterium]
MKITLKKIFLNNAQIKIISLILGYSFWYIFSQSHVSKIWLDAPICFYNTPQSLQISCKDKVKIQLWAKRSDLYTIDRETLAFHIDMQEAKKGDIVMKLNQNQLLLPESIKMVRCYPTNIAVKINEIKTQT